VIILDHRSEIRYVVDFDPELARIVTETKYLEQLGFAVPELDRYMARQVGTFITYLAIRLMYNFV
jgi:hypothetical protein